MADSDAIALLQKQIDKLKKAAEKEEGKKKGKRAKEEPEEDGSDEKPAKKKAKKEPSPKKKGDKKTRAPAGMGAKAKKNAKVLASHAVAAIVECLPATKLGKAWEDMSVEDQRKLEVLLRGIVEARIASAPSTVARHKTDKPKEDGEETKENGKEKAKEKPKSSSEAKPKPKQVPIADVLGLNDPPRTGTKKEAPKKA